MINSKYFYTILIVPILILTAYGQQNSDLPEDDYCISCHMDMEMMPDNFNEKDIHLQKGLSCAGCHGGNPNLEGMEGMSEEEGFVGVPDKKDIPQFCGKCHSDINLMRKYQPRISTDQVSQYYTSMHGKKLKEGDDKVAECTSCHTSHAIFPADDPLSTVYDLNVPSTCKKCHSDEDYMKEYTISTDQYVDFASSVHGEALLKDKDTGAPACNDCHGNHGAAPPGVASVNHVCGTCHYNNMEFFSTTIMAEKFQERGIHGCEECHGYHKVEKTYIKMVGTDEKAVCIKCHEKGDAGYKNAKVLRGLLMSLSENLDSLSQKQEKVQQVGMDDTEINYMYQEANQSLIKARTLVHTFDTTQVAQEIQTGVKKTNNALNLAKQLIEENQTRRLGFGVATIFITVLVIALYFKVRDIDKSEKKA